MKTQEQLQEFAKEYNELCQKHGIQLVGFLKTVPTNHGTFELAIELRIVPTPEQPAPEA